MIGVVNSVSAWLTSNPPTTAMPSGWRSSAPAPMPNINGTAPSKAARVVIMIGRKRVRQAWWMACSGLKPRVRWASRAKSISRIPFFLTIPISSTMPIRPMMLKS
ncbi:hypothetical protein D3C79_935800 [compost metagenome]